MQTYLLILQKKLKVKILNKSHILKSEQTAGTIGFFDGVHLGHKFLLDNLIQKAKTSNQKSIVVTFRENPKYFFIQNTDIKQLTAFDEKITKLQDFDIDYCLVLDFDQTIASLTAIDFLMFLKQKFCLKSLIVGYDHTFGSDKIKDFNEIKKITQTIDIDAFKVEQFSVLNKKIGSSFIRHALENGDIENANAALGYDYFLNGTVVCGNKIGKTIDFPTANLKIDLQKLVPKNGVYMVEVEVANKKKYGMLNIGNRPTVNGHDQTIEVNIFDFNGDLYGQSVKVNFKHYLREEKKFNSLQELKNQLCIDKKQILSQNKAK